MLHGRTQAPLTWTELFRILAPEHSDALFCSPVPLPALLAGQDTDWVEIAPYDVSNWDKLSLSPYSNREDISYLVVAPAGGRNENRVSVFVCYSVRLFVYSFVYLFISLCHVQVSNYFKQLSLVYQDSELGRHRPIPCSNTRSEAVYTFESPSSPLYLHPDSLSAIKRLLSSVIFPQLSDMSWPLEKPRRDTDAANSSLSSHAYRLHSTGPSAGGEGLSSVVLYLLNTGAPHQQVDLMRVFSEAILDVS